MEWERKPGYFKALSKFLSELDKISILTGHGEVESHWKVFETSDEAFTNYSELFDYSTPEFRERPSALKIACRLVLEGKVAIDIYKPLTQFTPIYLTQGDHS